MYFDTRFVEYLTVQVKLSSTKHGLPLFQAACAVEIDMGLDNIQLDPSKHKNYIASGISAGDDSDNRSTYYDNKVDGSSQNNSTGSTGNKKGDKSGTLTGCSAFYYRPYYSRCIGAGGENQQDYRDGTFKFDSTETDDDKVDVTARDGGAQNADSQEGAVIADAGGCDPCELQLGARPQSRLPSIPPVWMQGFYPAADHSGLYACAHAGEPRYIRVGACNFNPAHYTVGYWGFLELGSSETDYAADGKTFKYGMNSKGLGQGATACDLESSFATGAGNKKEGATGTNGEYNFCDQNIRDAAALWSQNGGLFVYSKFDVVVSGAPTDKRSQGHAAFKDDDDYDNQKTTSTKIRCMIDTKVALIERFYAMYPYLNLSNQPPSTSSGSWTGSSERSNSQGSYGHGHMATDGIIIEGSQNNARRRVCRSAAASA